MPKYMKVEGHSKLVKDPSRGTILNTNIQEIAHARMRKKKKNEKEEHLQSLETRMEDMSKRLDTLTSLVEKLVER